MVMMNDSGGRGLLQHSANEGAGWLQPILLGDWGVPQGVRRKLQPFGFGATDPRHTGVTTTIAKRWSGHCGTGTSIPAP